MTKRIHRALMAVFAAAAMISSGSSALAQSGTMTASGNWSDSTKWSGSIIADGEDNTATINANVTGTVNSDRSIGNIIFNNASTVNSSGGSTLTLATSTEIPNIRTTFRGRKGILSAPIGGNDGLQINWPGGTLANTGTIVLSGNNIYSGGTFLVAGEIHVGHVNALGTGTITFGGGGLVSSDGTAYTFTNTIAITNNVLIGKYHVDDVAPGTGAMTFSDTSATALGATRTFTVDSGIQATFAQAFSGTAGITKAGAGTLVLTGASTYDGATTINASGGTLEFSSIGNVSGSASNLGTPTSAANGRISIGTSGSLVYKGTGNITDREIRLTNTGAVLDQSGSDLLKWNGQVQGYYGLGGTYTLTLKGSSSGTGEIAGVISQAFGGRNTAVIKEGIGTWTLSGNNTYAAYTTVSAGTLLFTKAAALPGYNLASRVSVASGATLAVNVDAGGWTSAQIDSLLGATTAAFAAGSKLGIDVATTFTYTNDIGATQAAKGLVKSGEGTLTLSGVNTYTGDTTINAGTLALGASGTLDTDNNVVLAGGTLSAGDFNNSLGTLNHTASSTIALGSGTLSFADSSALAGTWSGTLDLTGTLGATTLRFGTNANGLTEAQLDSITCLGQPVSLIINAQGYILIQTGGTVYRFR